MRRGTLKSFLQPSLAIRFFALFPGFFLSLSVWLPRAHLKWLWTMNLIDQVLGTTNLLIIDWQINTIKWGRKKCLPSSIIIKYNSTKISRSCFFLFFVQVQFEQKKTFFFLLKIIWIERRNSPICIKKKNILQKSNSKIKLYSIQQFYKVYSQAFLAPRKIIKKKNENLSIYKQLGAFDDWDWLAQLWRMWRPEFENFMKFHYISLTKNVQNNMFSILILRVLYKCQISLVIICVCLSVITMCSEY